MSEATWRGQKLARVSADSLPKSDGVGKAPRFPEPARARLRAGARNLSAGSREWSGCRPPGGVLAFRDWVPGFPAEHNAEIGTRPWPLGALIPPSPRVLGQNVCASSLHT